MHLNIENDIERILISKEEIKERLVTLAKGLVKDYKGKDWTLVAILNGSLVFLADLIRLIPYQIRLDTISASTYGDSTLPKGDTVILNPFKTDIAGRDVLIIDDIIDTGHTLSRVVEDIKKYQPSSLKTCVFLNRVNRRLKKIEPDYYCFEIGNDYVVGYGLDYDNNYRNLPYIAALKPEIFQRRY